MAEGTHFLRVCCFVPDTWNMRLRDKHLSVQAFLRDKCRGWLGRKITILLLLRLDLVPAPGVDVTAQSKDEVGWDGLAQAQARALEAPTDQPSSPCTEFTVLANLLTSMCTSCSFPRKQSPKRGLGPGPPPLYREVRVTQWARKAPITHQVGQACLSLS